MVYGLSKSFSLARPKQTIDLVESIVGEGEGKTCLSILAVLKYPHSDTYIYMLRHTLQGSIYSVYIPLESILILCTKKRSVKPPPGGLLFEGGGLIGEGSLVELGIYYRVSQEKRLSFDLV